MKNVHNLDNSLAHNRLACPFVRIAVECNLKDRWRSWLARLHDTEEVTGSSPVRFILFFAFIPPFRSCERGIARIGDSNFYGEINTGSNKFRIVLCERSGTHGLAAHTQNDARFRGCFRCSNPLAYPVVGKFSPASSAGGRLHL